MKHPRGFTLIELVVVIIILAVLSAIAVPKFIDLGWQARIATVNAMVGALWATANNMRAACLMQPPCSADNPIAVVLFNGHGAAFNYGWLDAGDILNDIEIDGWVVHDGFTASIPSSTTTVFSLDAAPTPSQCSVSYVDAYSRGAASGPGITTTTTGC